MVVKVKVVFVTFFPVTLVISRFGDTAGEKR